MIFPPDEIERLEMLGNSKDAWLSHARGLFLAAGKLSEHCTAVDEKENWEDGMYIFPVTLLLYGLSLECFLKALWVHRGGKFVNAQGKVEKNCKALGHNLLELVSLPTIAYPFEADQKKNDEERSVLVRLQKYVIFAGRYPISKNPDDHKMRTDLNVTCASVFWRKGPDDEILARILTKVVNALA